MVLSFVTQSAKIFKKICLLQGGLTSSIFLDLFQWNGSKGSLAKIIFLKKKPIALSFA